MPFSDLTDMTTLLIRISEALSSKDGGPDETGGDVPDAFLKALYRNVPPEELRRRTPQDLGQAARSLWAFMAARPTGMPKIRILSPGDPDHAWLRGRSVIQIVNDDMPFLVDSVTAVLHRHDLVVLLVIHPVITVTCTPTGRAVADSGASGTIHESVMQIEIAGALSAEECQEVTRDLAAVLEDVRAAVADWAGMVGRCHASAIELSQCHTQAAAEDVREIAAFLTWLPQDNFTFLGYREYVLDQGCIDVVAGSGRGILRRDETQIFGGLREFMQNAPEVEAFVHSPQPIMISKASQRSTVHRAVLLDTVSIKRFRDDGTVYGQILMCGLFTSAAYARPVGTIPLLRQKIARVIQRSGLPPDSHDGKALQHLLDTVPRDELFQISEDQLYELGIGVLRLQERRGLALFVRSDPFERFLSCLIYMPRDRYSAEVEARVASVLEQAYGGRSDGGEVHLDESPLMRMHFTIDTIPGQIADVPVEQVEHSLTEATATFGDRLLNALVTAEGEEQALETIAQYRTAFPIAYTLRSSTAAALDDLRKIKIIERGESIALSLEAAGGALISALRLKIFHAETPVALSDALPILENFGLRVLNEVPYEIRPKNPAQAIWIQELELETKSGGPVDLTRTRALFEEAFLLVWSNGLENDGFNGLILSAGLSARQVTILRTYAKIWRQAGTTVSQAYMEDTLALHPAIARDLVALFEAYFDPHTDAARRDAEAQRITAAIGAALDEVNNLDEDKILRSFLLLVSQTLRTNFYQLDQAGAPKPYLSVKLHSREIDLLPFPRPLYEIYVYSVRMEGVHLRGGKVARGGIRWSDRKEDFRTEILGLMKAQQVKNAVIVPVGSKGGFVVKNPPANREAMVAEVVACYRMLISGMLDITDTYQGAEVIPPANVVRRDGDDPYLVVAADKGTATFSDIANGIAHDYGFWLDDAFASGGSVGYDHKKMGITARGAWEAVKRHFRELGKDIQTTPFDCIGIGDMSGDVFGNGMLLSPHTRLIAAFDHRHIVIDPEPDTAASWAERKRLFELPRSSWADYDRTKLSQGGAIFDRNVKSLPLSAESAPGWVL